VIRHWKITNFKSVAEASLPLAPLTLFAGPNSSGKSTLLQSILLVAQTMSARASIQPVILNGHLVKLGQLDDLRNSVTLEKRIQLCWTITPDPAEDRIMTRLRRLRSEIETTSCEVVFGLSDPELKSEQLNPTLFEFSLTSKTRVSTPQTTVESFIRLVRRKSSERQTPKQDSTRSRNPFTADFQIELDDASSNDLKDEYSDGKPVACELLTFLPLSLVVSFDEKAEIIRAILATLTRTPRQRYARSLTNPGTQISSRMIFELIKHIPQLETGLASLQRSINDETVSLYELLERLRRIRVSATPEMIEAVEEAGQEILTPHREIVISELPGPSLDDTVDYTRDFFTRQLKYLGPLREEPKTVYPLQNTSDPQDVGLHGEHTAAVLHRYRYTEVKYLPSSNFGPRSTNTEEKTVVLEDAVFDWLKYLDVAEKVDTIDEGKFGYGLKVTMAGGSVSHDLTHVGVGVSQVLPIVVMCLLAGHDTSVILEQPELHLNPKVQTRLADFFLSMAMLRKQCLIETHSEYLINRLRLRAAIAAGSEVSDLLKLYFVEQAGGLSTYRDVRINEFGTILSWPRGFFDQSQREVEEILRAASRKAL
jgi:predicted ATPase